MGRVVPRQRRAGGLERASAVVVLNSPETGRPIRLHRRLFHQRKADGGERGPRSASPPERTRCDARRRCSAAASSTLRSQGSSCDTCPGIERFTLYDVDPRACRAVSTRCSQTFGGVEVEVAPDVETALGRAPLISLATTAVTPHISDLSACASDATVLHVSLRDLTPEAILTCDNVVDDIDHVCRAQTSVHLAEQSSGVRDFIRCTLADVLTGPRPRRKGDGRSPSSARSGSASSTWRWQRWFTNTRSSRAWGRSLIRSSPSRGARKIGSPEPHGIQTRRCHVGARGTTISAASFYSSDGGELRQRQR